MFTFRDQSPVTSKDMELESKISELSRQVNQLTEMVILMKGSNLQYVANQTHELCMLAVNDSPDNIKYVHEHNKTYDICLKAVSHDGMLLEYCPKTFTDIEMSTLYREALQNNGYALQHIPFEQRTPELCLEAVYSAIHVNVNTLITLMLRMPVTIEYIQAWRVAIYNTPKIFTILPKHEELYNALRSYAIQMDYKLIERLDDVTEEELIEYIKLYPRDYWEACGSIYVLDHNPNFKIRFIMFLKSIGFYK